MTLLQDVKKITSPERYRIQSSFEQTVRDIERKQANIKTLQV